MKNSIKLVLFTLSCLVSTNNLMPSSFPSFSPNWENLPDYDYAGGGIPISVYFTPALTWAATALAIGLVSRGIYKFWKWPTKEESAIADHKNGDLVLRINGDYDTIFTNIPDQLHKYLNQKLQYTNKIIQQPPTNNPNKVSILYKFTKKSEK